ncbi:MAG: amidohydrolase [Bacteroidia bacterium]|nr:amidohydrolase [Bacteroidia bacterium]
MAQEITIYSAKKIYTADTIFRQVEAMAVQDGKIIQTGNLEALKTAYPKAKRVHFKNKFIYPGFIDAHSHFLGYAKGLKECNLVGTKSELEALKKAKEFAKNNKRKWIIGRGWDQNDWDSKSYPSIEMLDAAFPNTPVFLQRIDGHAAWINSAAIRELKLDVKQPISGGEFLTENGGFTGILIDNAVDVVSKQIPELELWELGEAIDIASKNCYKQGLTTVTEAGVDVKDVQFLRNLQDKGALPLRFYAMLSATDNNLAWIAENGILRSPGMHVCAVKFYLDGALGSRGALLKSDYCDRTGHKGLLLSSPAQLYTYSNFLLSKGFQVCVHAIGDSANKITLQTFSRVIGKNLDMRWRIEHAQIIDPKDFHYFREYNIIPSVQPTHATSDAPWVEKRICASRLPGAYAYETLRQQAGIVALGTDFPVEDISPIKTFYSAVTRLDAAGNLKEPFIPNQGLTRESALWGMTLWAAIASFEETDKGSLEVGKFADFVVTNSDLITVPDAKIPKVKVVATYINGSAVYKK